MERPVHFVNLIDKDSSGIAVVVRDIALRRRLQEKWGEFRFESYLLLKGEMPEDGEFSARRKPGEKYSAKKFPFRKMRSGRTVHHPEGPSWACRTFRRSCPGCVTTIAWCAAGQRRPGPVRSRRALVPGRHHRR